MRATGDDGGHLVAWLDLTAGVAGDMLLGALVDAGASLAVAQTAVDAVIPGTVRLVAHETVRGGMRALKVDVELLAPDQDHRRWSDIRDRLTAADLEEGVRARARAAFERLAVAESRVHGTSVEDVHFHEVGAWDSIADVVGCCAALGDLGVDDVVASRITLGSGSVRAAHGRVAVPVPAVLELVRGWDVTAGGDGELATPTGAALVTTLAPGQTSLPALTLRAIGLGAGTKEQPDRANVVRVVIGSAASTPGDPAGPGATAATSPPASEGFDAGRPMAVIEANVDDLDPRLWPVVIDALLAAGAADAWTAPITMKRGRPAQLLSVLCHREEVAALRDLVLSSTSTIGVRVTDVTRWALDRGWEDVFVEGRPVGVKIAHRDGRIVNVSAEFRDVEAAATASGRPAREVLDAAEASAASKGWVRGAPVPPTLRPEGQGAAI